MMQSQSTAETESSLPRARNGATARDVAHRCAEAAGTILRAASAQPRPAVEKGTTRGGRSDIVTATDPAIERAVLATLREAYPEHAVLGEETGGHPGEAAWLWVIDPIDGTRNFSAGIPLMAFNLALYGRGEPRLALTYDPFREETFYAETGGGATVNGGPLQVTPVERVADVFLCADIGLDDGRGRELLGALREIFPGFQSLRLIGTTALGLAYVAAGRFDAYIHPSPQVWDFAPGALLVREAGGVVSELDGSPLTLASRSVVASGPAVHGELVARFQQVVAGALGR
ncbi:MAG: inositol monophosphatase family protein [Dehalococcoidia bacterium]